MIFPFVKKASLLILFVSNTLAVWPQDSLLVSPGTVSKESMEVDLTRISIESRNLSFSLQEEMRNTISDAELERLKQRTQVTVEYIDSTLKARHDHYLEMRNVRSIKNQINFWKQKLEQIKVVDDRITKITNELDKNRIKYARELELWKEVEKTSDRYAFDQAVMHRIGRAIKLLDTTLVFLEKKSNFTLELLDMTSAMRIQISERIDRYENILFRKQEDIFKSGYPNLFSINSSGEERRELRNSYLNLHRGEFQNLGIYFRNNIQRVIWHLVLLILVVVIFILIKRVGIPDGKDEDAVYRRSLKIIISNPINSAWILILFAFAIIYTNKPLLLIDLFKILVSIPLAITLINMSHRKYWSTIIAFEILVVLQIINANLSAHLAFSRYLLLFTGLLEIHTLASFLRKIRRSAWRNEALYNIVVIIAGINILLAVAGLVANVAGKVLLAQTLLGAVTGTVLAAILIFLAMMVGNGIFMLLIDSKYADYFRFIKQRKKMVKEKITLGFQFLAGLFLFYYILEAFGFEVVVVEGIRDFFTNERTLGAVTFTWGNILTFFLVIWLSVEVSKVIRVVLEEDVLGRMGLSKGLPNTIALLVRYTLVTMGVLAAATAAGLQLTKLTIILGAFSVGIGFGLQNIFNNLVSGLILLLERPIKIGDTIEVGPLIGVVKRIGIRASNVHTLDGAEIIVPNGNLISSEVINWTLTDQRRRIEVLIGVAYGSDIYKTREVLFEVLNSHPEIVRDPNPVVLLNNFGDSSLDFRILFWTENFEDWVRIRSEVNFKIHDVLKDAGIEIPFPQRDIHIISNGADTGQKG